MMYQLVHYSEHPIRNLFNIKQKNQEVMNRKPRGLWVSIDSEDGWKEWCVEQEFALERLRYRYELLLVEDHNILQINTHDELIEFTKIYGIDDPDFLNDLAIDQVKFRQSLGFPEEKTVWSIDWEMVADEYSGIYISFYTHSACMYPEINWFYGWDCSSGCIWDVDIIEELRFRDAVHLENSSGDVPRAHVPTNSIDHGVRKQSALPKVSEHCA